MPAAAKKIVRDAGGRPKNQIAPNRLRELRERHKDKKGGLWLTTAEVAKILGIGEADVSRHENHVRALTDEHVILYSKLYKVRPDQLFANLTVSK